MIRLLGLDFSCTKIMKITWDEPKRLANLDRHGLDFADLTVDFILDARIRPVGSAARSRGDLGHLHATGKPQGKEHPAMTRFKPGRGYTEQNWEEVADNPEATDEELAAMVPFVEAFPELAESIRRGRGRPQVANPKQAVTLRLDPETVQRFKEQGPDWRARMSEALKRASRT
jgi:uncharacterized protein (DUF4415 family)